MQNQSKQPTQPIQEWEEYFYEKFCRKNRNPEKMGEIMDRWFFPDGITPFEVKSFIHSLLQKQAQEIEEAVKRRLVYTPEEVAKLNAGIPNTMQEQIYFEAIGFQKAISESLLAIKQITTK